MKIVGNKHVDALVPLRATSTSLSQHSISIVLAEVSIYDLPWCRAISRSLLGCKVYPGLSRVQIQ